jgi:GNAT superfamily N-acetyltransferase
MRGGIAAEDNSRATRFVVAWPVDYSRLVPTASDDAERAPAAPVSSGAGAFGPDYVEELTLRDGTRVRLRPIRPSDKDRLVEGLGRLSPQSRYLRFFTDKERLTEAELRYLTELDGVHHFAIGISRVGDDGQEGEGLGIGRFVVLPTEPTVAEPALAVVDHAQGLGLGRLLLLRLIAAAAERGIHTFRCDFLAVNRGMQHLLADVSPDVCFRSDGPVVTAEFRLPHVPADEPIERAPLVGPMFAWMKLVAEQVMELRHLLESGSEQLKKRWGELQAELGTKRWGHVDGGHDREG